MTPEEVPDEWLVVAHDGYYDDIHSADHIATWRALRSMLAAVIPLIEQQARELIAAELNDEWGVRRTWTTGDHASHGYAICDTEEGARAALEQYLAIDRAEQSPVESALVRRLVSGWRVVEDDSKEATSG
ncbi:hypothetical protein Caci_3004 [Catenulispora acidiphila DSM 44928]|uniref:Uncharacterized protein n=1 Tax=Catenulispora acidiphila (strain DSM 44928 / JCM 14897 / NBRC 102108 / NRRL B-24433 / ID139908) TaxID=479433 RepID=C7Q321_CATAD|nr:hypothetical protein [Catenulispora acidiphila]ACU71913.1 hypothetical protein Caci_3004 [Catenulispora acidiphila DSM 44928]